MPRPEKLWKTTLVIWSDQNPGDISAPMLADAAINGDSLLLTRQTIEVIDPAQFPDTRFFGVADGEEDHI